MTKDTQILVRLEEEQKKKWKKHAGVEDRYRDLTNLIEQAVEERISEDSDDATVESELMNMAQQIENLQDGISDIKDISERIEDTQATNIELERTAERIENIVMSREQRDNE